ARGHEPGLGRVVHDLIHRDPDEVHDHDFGDRELALEGGTDPGAENGRLGNRRVEHTVLAVLGGQSRRGTGDSAARVGEVLAQQKDPGVGGQAFVKRLVDRLQSGDRPGRCLGFDRGHAGTPFMSWYRSLSSSAGSGTPDPTASLTAASTWP